MKSRWTELADTNTIKGLKIAQIDVHEYPGSIPYLHVGLYKYAVMKSS